jgi:hypothetical protein
MTKQTIKVPKTTVKEPYIEFRFNEKGRLIKLLPTSSWWGGIHNGFHSSDGYEGNTCLPKNLKKYIEVFKLRKIKSLEKQILTLQKSVECLKSDQYNFIGKGKV